MKNLFSSLFSGLGARARVSGESEEAQGWPRSFEGSQNRFRDQVAFEELVFSDDRGDGDDGDPAAPEEEEDDLEEAPSGPVGESEVTELDWISPKVRN